MNTDRSVVVEQAYCEACDSAIRHEHRLRRPLKVKSVTDWPRHESLGWCEHCGRLWRSVRELTPGGGYDQVEFGEITDQRVKAPIIREIERRTGTVLGVA